MSDTNIQQKILNELTIQSGLLSTLDDNINKLSTAPPTPPKKILYDVENFITTSVPVKPDDVNSNLYQKEKIHDVLGRNSGPIKIINEFPGILYIITSTDGVNFRPETTIFEGQSKTYDDLYIVGLRSPTANLKYRVTERDVTTVSGQIFTGSRFKQRRDRNGVVVFEDDMESPTFKFTPIIVGIATIARSTDTSYSGDFSIKSVVGAAVGNNNTLAYFHPDFHAHQVGIQVEFASASVIYDLHLVIDYFDGLGNEYYADVFTVGGTAGGNSLIAIDQNGANYVLVSGVAPDLIQIFNEIHSWNIMKLVVDLETHQYVSAEVNGKKVSFNIPVQTFPAVGVRKHIEGDVTVYQANAVVYIDQYIFTEDEV
jgi:hypothetical protein